MSTYAVLLDTSFLTFVCIIELHDCDMLAGGSTSIHPHFLNEIHTAIAQ